MHPTPPFPAKRLTLENQNRPRQSYQSTTSVSPTSMSPISQSPPRLPSSPTSSSPFFPPALPLTEYPLRFPSPSHTRGGHLTSSNAPLSPPRTVPQCIPTLLVFPSAASAPSISCMSRLSKGLQCTGAMKRRGLQRPIGKSARCGAPWVAVIAEGAGQVGIGSWGWISCRDGDGKDVGEGIRWDS